MIYDFEWITVFLSEYSKSQWGTSRITMTSELQGFAIKILVNIGVYSETMLQSTKINCSDISLGREFNKYLLADENVFFFF